MLSCTIYPCSNARQRQRMMLLERSLDRRARSLATPQEQIAKLVASKPGMERIQVQPVTVHGTHQLDVYDQGYLRMTIHLQQP